MHWIQVNRRFYLFPLAALLCFSLVAQTAAPAQLPALPGAPSHLHRRITHRYSEEVGSDEVTISQDLRPSYKVEESEQYLSRLSGPETIDRETSAPPLVHRRLLAPSPEDG
jgi:hypothetical protein